MSTLNSSLYRAIYRGNKHLVLELASSNSLLNYAFDYVDPHLGDTPLHQACKQGWLDIVKLLIEVFGCDPNVTSNYHQNPLHYACRYGHIDVVEYLINEQQMNPLLGNNIDDLEPLDYALNNNKIDIAVYICQQCISSDELLNPDRIKTTLNLIKSIIRADPFDPKWKTADEDSSSIVQLVGSSKLCISHMPSAVVLEILKINSTDGIMAFEPDWRTADGDKLIELVCQSETCISQISSAVILMWLENVTIDLVRKSLPDSKTADGEILIQLVCQSEMCLAHVSTEVLSKWLNDTTLDLEEVIVTPGWRTADSDTLLLLVFRSDTFMSRISSAVMLKWLRDTTLNDNLANIIIPEWKTADGDTLLQLVLQSEMSISRISSTVLSKWLSDSSEVTADLMKMVDPNWKTLEGDRFFHVLFISKIEDKKLIEQMQYYIQEKCLNPDILDSNENTALHIACQANRTAIVSFLLNEARCDPCIKNKKENFPFDMTTNPKIINYLCQCDQVAVYSKTVAGWMNNRSIDDTTMVSILKVLVDNHKNRTKDGSTLLHLICNSNDVFRDKVRLLHYLLTDGHCDPNSLDSKGQMPLQLTSNLKSMEKLVEHGAKMTTDIVFKVISSKHIKDSIVSELLTLSTRNRTMLWNTNDLNSNGDTALHLACKVDKPAIVNYLLTEAMCDPNVNDRYHRSPLELTTNFEIVKMLIKHGSRVTPELVLRFEAMDNCKVIELLSTTCSWNPDDRNSDGYTALHLACKSGSPTTVNRLLSVAHCDPNIKSNNQKVPLQMTTNPEIIKDLIRHGAKSSIMYESYQKALGTNMPVKPPVKVFVIGNPFVGKSSLTAALKKKLNILARFFTSGKVSGVDQKTVGIVPHEMFSDIFGRVTLYDFAGHREFYSGHAALLQTAIQSTPPVFLLVVNLYQDDDAIAKDIMYWISFLENQCASVNSKPHIILVGSHADFLKSSGTNAKNKIKVIVDSLDTKCFINMELVGFVAIDCQYHESSGMNDLRRLLIKSCNELRINEPITFNAHCFLVYLIDMFTNSSAVTINTIYNDIENQLMSQTKGSILEFLPQNFEALYKICIELNDRGHILLLKDRVAVENSYIVIDKEFLLSEISGTVFAPEGFKQYKQLSTNTGVVPLSKIAECFPNKNLDILIGFLTHLEFCHEISDQGLHQLISEQYCQVSGEHYYLFPGLISTKADDTVWKSQSNCDYNFGWILTCSCLEQFFSSRFLQVLLLRLAFSFVLEASCDNPNQSIGIHRNYYLWKNGIFWGSDFHMQTLVEVTSDNKSVTLLARFRKVNLLQCIQHRSNVIDTILHCKEQFCPRVQTTESFVDSSSPLQYPLNTLNEVSICTLQDLATAVVNESSVVLQCDEIDAENFLSFEPYLEMKSSTIYELWDEKNEKKVISERFLSTFAEQASEKLTLLIEVLIEKSASSTRDDQLYQNLLKWRDGDMNNQKTYRDLRQIVDQYSVFAGRNVLELARQKGHIFSPQAPAHPENETKQASKLFVKGNRPKSHELQMLEFSDGKKLRIMKAVAPQWKQMAVALGFSAARIKSIESEHYRPDDASFKIFSCWLEGEHNLKPPTWDVLIRCLKQANLLDLAEMLSNIQIGNNAKTTLLHKEVESSKNEIKMVQRNTGNKVLQSLTDHGGSIPSLDIKALEVIKGRRGRRIKVIDSVGSQWEELAKALDMEQEDIDMIKTTHGDNDEEACRAMLATWLEGNNGEVSWTAFIQALIDAGLPELADSLKDIMNKEDDDVGVRARSSRNGIEALGFPPKTKFNSEVLRHHGGGILQSAHYSDAKMKAHIPFIHHYILECDYSGIKYTIKDHDITLNVPEGAVANDETIHIEIDVTTYGHFVFPKNTQPISPIVWLCLLEKDTKLKKPFKLVLPHFLTGLTKDNLHNHQVGLAKANHHNFIVKDGEMNYVFNPCDSQPLFASSGNKSYAILELEHCCFYCLTANVTSDLARDVGYCLTRIEGSVSPQRNEIYFIATYFLKTCIQALKEQFQKKDESHISHHHFKFKDATTPHIKFIPPDDDQHVIALMPSTAEIKASELDFWSTPFDQMQLRHDLKMYPPRVKMTVMMTNTSPFKVSVKITGCSSELDMDIAFPLEVAPSVPSGSQQLQQSQSHTIVTKGDKPKLRDVFEKLLDLAVDWKHIGTLLGVENHILQEIKQNEEKSLDRLQEMLSEWLKIDNPPPTWDNLASAVKPFNPAKAQEIKGCIAE